MELTVPKPAHVAADLVYDFDYRLDPDFCRDPFARASQIIKEAPPVFWTPRNGGHWMITSFKAISSAARDTGSFSSVLVPKEMLAHLPADMPTPMTAIPATWVPCPMLSTASPAGGFACSVPYAPSATPTPGTVWSQRLSTRPANAA